MVRSASLLLLLFFPLFLSAAGVEWQTDAGVALAIARRDAKMLVVYYRIPARGWTPATDRAVAEMTVDELFIHSLDAFVPLRIEGATAPSHPVVDELRKEQKPLLAVYDASGVPLARFADLGKGWEKIAEEVLAFRTVRELATKSAELRNAGDSAAADFVLGHVLRNLVRLPDAIAAFVRAAEGFENRGDRESGQLARLGAASARYANGQKQHARLEMQNILDDPATPSVEAEAQLLWGGILESNARTPVGIVDSSDTRRRGGAPRRTSVAPISTNPAAYKPAIEAYRKAYALAQVGSSTERTARLALERLDKAPLPAKGDGGSRLRVIPPVRATFTGHSEFIVDAPQETARIELFLDERQVATMRRAPFRAAVDVGSTPRVRVVKARAFDASDALLGEAAIRINDRVDNFYVTIVNPAENFIRDRVTAEVDVRVPPGRTVATVVLSWNGKPVATVEREPFRAAFEVEGTALGYLHARATLDDGTTADTTRVYNAKLMETVEVGVVTVLAAIATREGVPLVGLAASDFTIDDEGQRVEHELLSSPEDPVTIGIALDSSSSMEGSQLYSLRAATRFLESVVRPVDRAFVVAFDTRVSLVHERSNDLQSLRASLLDRMPSGGTSIFDGVTFALQQFQGIPGRKALVVFSDGREGTSSASTDEAERLARTVGVPIYLVVPRGGERLGHALRGLSSLTGGAMYHSLPEKDFRATFDRLAEELRAQYVLQFRMPSGVASGQWRRIRLTVPGRDAIVRMIAGYRAN